MKVEKISLKLSHNSYDIVIGPGILQNLGKYLRDLSLGEKIAVVTHPRVDRLYGAQVRKSLKDAGYSPVMISLPDGERYKTLDQVGRVYDKLVAHRFERDATLVALGGGVVGDMAGFVAATFLRGISYIQCPTTVVAQVDASIGGKTGVDHPKGKNLIGAFYQPRLVCIDPTVLTTLSKREYIAGLAEVVKYGVIFDPAFIGYLERYTAPIKVLEPGKILYCIKKSAAIKAEIVQADERESSLRKILNYGHTFGHAIETMTGYRKYKHGEAVSIGMVMASRLACMLGILSEIALERQVALLRSFGLPTRMPRLDPGCLLSVMERDKKVVDGVIFFILPEKIGSVRIMPVDRKDLKVFLRSVFSR
ncbi:MAG: 3-dehydroquinate synthase [Nitrospira sp.]|nr:3-dehydroquinate synthase [Candidatus Manganitrophaceae bacterium]HIL34207.1 3-dehydroquinate synthase [Candidatus Manganitrophaceae bacterium]